MKTIKVNGMHCANCKAAVEKAVSAIPGIKNASVDLGKKELMYEDNDESIPVDQEVIKKAIIDIGFEPEE